jgi:Tol biopolymer transport system component
VFATHGSGICLTSDRGVATTYDVQLLGPGLEPVARLPVAGIPSRARVSSDGRWAATTTFVTGHSYTSANFSTATEIFNMAEGTSLGNLETFSFERGGKPYSAVDINVWGVTFAPDGTRFYTTVATGGGAFLAEGDSRARTITISDVSVECPSLSPDASRIAYKKRVNQTTWRIHVRDLASGADVALAETRSVDDQLEWWDDQHVVYGLQREGSAETDVWTVPADGSGSPELLIEHAWSPAVVR